MIDRIETNQKDLSINCDVRGPDGHLFRALDAGKLFLRSVRCPHLGCHVSWNSFQGYRDCRP